MNPRTLPLDRRAVTPAITHVLTIAFTSILVIALLVGAGGYLDNEERSSARQELNAIGNRLADEIDRVDNLAEEGSRVSITTHHPEEITGGGYTVSHEPASACGLTGDNRSCLVLESHETPATARVPVVNDTAVSVESTGDGAFNLTANEPISTSATSVDTRSAGLNVRVGVASDIREDPLGSRLTARNVPPIPLFDVEPQPATTAATHFFNGSASLDQDGNVTDYKWGVGDDGLYTAAGEIAPHWFDRPGKHAVTLRVADDARDTASTTQTKNVTVSGLEYTHDLDSQGTTSLQVSFYNNWSREVRLDSLYLDDLNDRVDRLDDGDQDISVSEVNVDTDTDGDRDTYIEYGRFDCSGYWCGSPPYGLEIPEDGVTINLDQPIDHPETSYVDANVSAPDTVPIVDPGETVTITLRGLNDPGRPNLEGTEWRIGVAYLAGDTATETIIADRADAPNVRNFTMNADGNDASISFTAEETVDDIGVTVDGPTSRTLDESDFAQSSVGLDTYEYEASIGGLDSGAYEATLDTAETGGNDAYDLPLRAHAVAVDDGSDAAWNSGSDWNNITASRGIVHESVGDRDARQVSLGYSRTDAGGTNLSAYWPMDDDDGDTMDDAAFPATNRGTTTDVFNRTVGLFGTSSYAFTSGASKVEVGSTDTLSGGEDATLTVSTWVHPREAISNSNGAAVLGKLNASTGGDWGIVLNSSCPDYADGGCDGTPTIGYYGGTESDEYALLHGPVTQPDAWHHVAFVLDGRSDELDLYYDGRIVESVDGIPDFASANTSRNVLVGHHPGTGQTYDGYVDETRIYNRALTGGEIQQLAETSTEGSFTTDWTNTSSTVTATNLNLSTSTDLNGGSVIVRVETDEGELSDPIRLEDDRGTYEVTGLSTDADGFRLEVSVESGSRNLSPVIDSMVVHERP